MATQKLIFSTLFLIFAVLGVESSVPVLLWGSKSLSSLPIPLAGHSVSSNAFHKNYLEKLLPCQNCDKKHLVVFVQDKLSVEDFTHYGHVFEDTNEGGIFNNVKSYMGSNPSLTLSSVHLQADSINQLKKKFENVQEVHLPKDDISSVKPAGPNSLLVVHLPDTHGNGRVENNLKQNDGHIAHVLKQYADNGVPYTAMYTARESSKILSNEAVYAQGRHLLAAKEDNGTAIEVTGCLLAYYTKVSINTIRKGKVVVHPVGGIPDQTKSKCDNSSAENELVLTWGNAGQNTSITKVTVKMTFNMTRDGYWTTSQMLLSYTNTSDNAYSQTDLQLNAKSINAWRGYSFHCSHTGKEIRNFGKNDSLYVHFVMEGFQVQPFNLTSKKGQVEFSYPNDCIGFFTIPIWSGLITAFILIGILTFGMYMMVMINTQDRFDDPKGMTITVTADDSK